MNEYNNAEKPTRMFYFFLNINSFEYLKAVLSFGRTILLLSHHSTHEVLHKKKTANHMSDFLGSSRSIMLLDLKDLPHNAS